MSDQKKTRADVIAEIQKTNDLLRQLVDVLTRNSGPRTRSTVGSGNNCTSSGGSGGGGGPGNTVQIG